MIHYHGGPISPERAAFHIWKSRHAFISFAHPEQIELAAQVCQSFAIDNGAFSFWKSKKKVNWKAFYDWAEKWLAHPGCDWAVIPDVIDGSERDNDVLLKQWPFKSRGVPVWHLNESPERLKKLADEWPRVCLGSSGEFDVSSPQKCLGRLFEVLPVICKNGQPITKLHGLRMLRGEIVKAIPLSSADSCTVARNIGMDVHWRLGITPLSKAVRGAVLVDRLEHHNSPSHLSDKKVKMKGFGL